MDFRREIEALEVSMKIEPGRRLFPFHRYQSLSVKLLITAGVDVLLLSGVTIGLKAVPGLLILRAVVPVSLSVINLGLAVVYRFAAAKFYLVFLINSILSVGIYYLLLILF